MRSGEARPEHLVTIVTQVTTRVAKILRVRPGSSPVDAATLVTAASLAVSAILWWRVTGLQRDAREQRGLWKAWREEHPRDTLHLVDDGRRRA